MVSHWFFSVNIAERRKIRVKSHGPVRKIQRDGHAEYNNALLAIDLIIKDIE